MCSHYFSCQGYLQKFVRLWDRIKEDEFSFLMMNWSYSELALLHVLGLPKKFCLFLE